MIRNLSTQVDTAFRRLESLRQSDMPHNQLTSKLIAELDTALHELHVTTDELIERNEEVAASRQILVEERRRYQELFEFAPDGYLVTDTEGIILDANNAATELFKIRKAFLIGMPLVLFIHSRERDNFRILQNRLKKGVEKKSEDLEFVMQSSKRTPFPTSITVETVAIVNEHTKELRWLLRDITKRRQMEEELQKADKLESLGILAGGIAHDFNNFLTVIIGNLSLVKMYTKNDEKVSQYLQEMGNAIKQTRALSSQLLTFAKGGKPLTEAVSLGSLIEEVSTFALSGSKVQCKLSLTEELPLVEIDSGQITQVISNLLINADQAMPAGGIIKIRAQKLFIGKEMDILPLRTGEYVALTIADEGMGIAKQDLSKIFDPYFSTKEKGSGLGLTVCYSIVKKHGGHISVQSVLGEGTSFTVYLPVSEKAEKDTTEDTISPGEGKVLFMDDEESVRQTAGEMLNFLGYDVDFAADGDEAINLYKEAFCSDSPYNLVICDLTIRGGMGGKKTIRELIKISPDVKAIVSSGYSYEALLADYEEYGFCDIIAKPYRLQELGQVLSRVLK